MKRKILIVLLVVLALSVSVLAGCNMGIISIQLKSGSLKTTYYVGETVDLSSAKITVEKSDGSTEDIALTSAMLDKAITTTEAGKTTYTVTYEGKTCPIEITVLNPTIALKANTLTTEYYVGDEVSLQGAKLTVTEGEASRDVDLTAAMISPAISTAQAGKTTHTISYNGATTTVDVTVTAPTIALKQGSLKLEYLVGDVVSLENAKITVTCGNRPVTEVALTQTMLDKAISTEAVGSTEYTISYNGATAKFTVIVRQVKSINSVEGLNLEPIKGESVVLTNAKLNVTYSDDTTGQVALTASMLDKAISTAEGGKTTYTVSYGGKTLDIEINVQDISVESIAIAEDLDKEYYLGYTSLDIKAQKLVVTLANGTTRNIALESAEFSPELEENATAGNKEYTLTYEGKTTTLSFTVCDIELQLADGFKKTYNVGDDIFVNGKLVNSQIKVIAVNDAHTVLDTLDVTQAMVETVFNTDTRGEKTLTIAYKNKTIEVGDIVVNPITIAVVTTGEGALATKLVKGSTVSYAGKLQITYTDNTTKLIDINSNMFNVAISTASLGETVYTVSYKDAESAVTIKVIPAASDKTSITAWQMPAFIHDYEIKNGSINESPLTESADFRKTAKYEVGNANKFLLVPDAFNGGADIEGTIWIKAKFAVKGEDNNYTELTGEALSEFVAIQNNAYLFSNTAAGKTVKITITADEDYHTVSAGVTPLTFEFVIVENGYNVYDQDGLAVMTDLVKPEIWADILGCAVDANGEYAYLPDASKALKLEADNEPLFKYVGKVDWIILHGDITINPDKLPSAYFWNGNEGTSWTAANNALDQSTLGTARKAMLQGSLREFKSKGETGHAYDDYYLCKYDADDNNNKGFYATNKVNVSGNFGAITMLSGRSEGGRILESVIFRHTSEAKRKDEIGSQWHLFKMFVEKTPCDIVEENGDHHASMDYCHSPEKNFTLKNVSLQGTTSLSGTSAATDNNNNLVDYTTTPNASNKGNVSSGPAMINFTCKKMYLTNVLAEGFNVNISADNYIGAIAIDIDSCQITDSFSSAVFTWRGTVDVKNSYMANFGGPVFIIGDGDRRVGNESASPSITLDKNSYAESYALGLEPWYTALDPMVRQLFTTLQALNEQAFKVATGKSFTHTDDKGSNRINVIAIMIPETGSVFEDQIAGSEIVIKGLYTHNKENTSIVASMENDKFKELAEQNKPMIFNSGSCYAYLDMSVSIEDGQPVVSQTVKTIEQEGYPQWASWATGGTNDSMMVWINIKGLLTAGQSSSPYIGVLIGNFE